MKVILTEDIKGVGKKGQIIDAADGYARNFLLPKKKAVEATKSNLNELDIKQKASRAKAEKEFAVAQGLAETLKDKKVRIQVKAGEGGKLFGSVTSAEVAGAIEAQYGITLDRKKITLKEPIKTLGEAKASVRLHTEVAAEIMIEVVSEQA